MTSSSNAILSVRTILPLNFPYRQVPGRVQVDDQQSGGEAVIGLTLVCSDAAQHLPEERHREWGDWSNTAPEIYLWPKVHLLRQVLSALQVKV